MILQAFGEEILFLAAVITLFSNVKPGPRDIADRLRYRSCG